MGAGVWLPSWLLTDKVGSSRTCLLLSGPQFPQLHTKRLDWMLAKFPSNNHIL